MKIECRRDPESPYLMVWVRLECDAYGIRCGTEFAIDTGSPMTILSYPQAVSCLVPLDKLAKAPKPIRIGGVVADAYILPDVKLLFRTTERGKIFAYHMAHLYVLGPTRTQVQLPVPGILGADFLDQFTFISFSKQRGGRVFITDEDIKLSF